MASQQLIEIIIKAVDEASSAAEKVDNSLRKIGDSSSRLSKIPGFDAMKSKLSSVASTLDGKLGGALTKAANHFNNLKNRVTNVASNIRTKMGTALDGVRNKLNNLTNGSKGLASAMGFLKGAVSMTAGMIGFELVSGIVEAGRAAINASSQLDYFGGRLQNASGKTKLSAQEFSKFKTELGELQKEFRKVDMTAVGATVEEMTMKFKLPADKMADLSKMTAVVSSAFVKEGSTQENAILAVSDAMDGQFKRLQEIGITQDTLKKNGWDGNLENQTSLIDAMNKSLDELGFTDTAKDITNLDEAFTALSIAGGQLMQAILVPLTPILIQIIEAVINATDAVKPFIQTLQGAADALPDWLKDAGWAAALALGLYYVGTIIMGTVVPALAAAAVAAIDFAIAMLANPWTYVLLALVAIAYAIYEVGKAFGWWTDVGTMLEAISDGVRRLWEAFINSPQVQGAIKAVKGALEDLWNYLQPAISWIQEKWNNLFGEAGSNPDAVRMIWQAFQTLGDIASAVFPYIAQGFSEIMSAIDPLIYAIEVIAINLAGVLDGTISWQDAFINIISTIGSSLVEFQMNVGQLALQIGLALLTGIVSFAMQIPGMLWGFITQAVTRLALFVVLARAKAIAAGMGVLNGVINYIKQLPGRAYSALIAVVSRIVSAGSQWVSNAKTKAGEIVSSVYNTLTGLPGQISSALSGVVNAITSPFKSAYDSVCGIVDNIKSKVEEGMNAIGNLGGAQAGEEADGRVSLLDSATNYNITTDNSPVTVDHNLNISLDLKNVPSGMDSDTLIAALTDRKVLSALTGNSDFQLFDGRAKERLNLKVNRSRGV